MVLVRSPVKPPPIVTVSEDSGLGNFAHLQLLSLRVRNHPELSADPIGTIGEYYSRDGLLKVVVINLLLPPPLLFSLLGDLLLTMPLLDRSELILVTAIGAVILKKERNKRWRGSFSDSEPTTASPTLVAGMTYPPPVLQV